MPSQRKQINVRVDEETEGRIDRLRAAVSAALGIDVSVSDLFRMGLLELERKHAGQKRKRPE